ncbi:MAG: EthD family reductase [Dokdonella sp.]
MIRLNILYPNTPGSHFNLDYYLGTHMPMAKRLLGDVLKEVTLEHGLAGVEPDSPPTYIMSCHMRFESIEAFMQAWALIGEQLGGDIPNYTDVNPVIQFSEIIPFD